MITAKEAREEVNKSGLFTVIPLLSEHTNSNDEYIYKVVDEEIRRAASNGYLSIQIMIASIFPFDKAIRDYDYSRGSKKKRSIIFFQGI